MSLSHNLFSHPRLLRSLRSHFFAYKNATPNEQKIYRSEIRFKFIETKLQTKANRKRRIIPWSHRPFGNFRWVSLLFGLFLVCVCARDMAHGTDNIVYDGMVHFVDSQHNVSIKMRLLSVCVCARVRPSFIYMQFIHKECSVNKATANDTHK